MTGAFRLVINKGDTTERSYPLMNQPITIGRAADNAIVLDDKRVSRHHAAVSDEGGVCLLRDLNSQNGTWLSDRKIETAELRAGDIFVIGGSSIMLDAVGEDVFTHDDTAGGNTMVKPAKDILRNTLEERIDDSSIDILKRRTSMLSALYHLSRSIMQEFEIEPILNMTADIILRNIRAERVYIIMRDGATGAIRPVVTRSCYNKISPPSSSRGDTGTEHRLMFSRTLINKVMDEAVSLLVADAKRDARFRESESIFMCGIRSAMCVPLLGTESVIGTIYVDILNGESQFSQDELDLLTTMGNLAAIVIEQARLRENVRRESEARQSLMRYHSPQMVDEIVRGRGMCEVNERMISVLFADIKDFTPLSEQLGPMETSRLLSEYFDIVTDVVFSYRGSIDKFIGDAAMAIFGAPVPDSHHSEMAVRAAIDIQKEIRKLGKYRIRIGINSGPAVIGNIGSSKRIEYTAIGDTVNIAARLEKLAGPDEIFISGTINGNVRDIFRTREIGRQKVKGKTMEIDVYEVLGE